MIGQVRAAVRRGDLAEARRLADEAYGDARTTGNRDQLTAVALALEPIGESTWDGTIHQRCQEALAAEGVDTGTRVRLLALQAQSAVYLGLRAESAAASAEALAQCEHLHDLDTVVAALTARQLAGSGPDDVEELEQLAARMVTLGTRFGRPDIELRGRLWTVDAHWYRGRLSAIAGEIARMEHCVERQDDPLPRWHLLVTRASLALARGEFDESDRLQAQARIVVGSHPAVHGAEVAFGLLRGHHRGHAEDLFDEDTWRFGTDYRWDTYSRLGRAWALADGGRLDEAAAAYHRCGSPASWSVLPLGDLAVAAVGAQVACALGLTDDVALLRDRLLPHRDLFIAAGAGAGNFLGPVLLTLGRCTAVLGRVDEADDELRIARSRCQQIGAPGFLVEADCLIAELRRDAAAARTALPLARALGMTPYVERLEAVAGNVSDPLSPREREVARLVAQGLGNRAIAERLFIAERTAQNHVQHILTKLGFSNRSQIAAWMSSR